jgi:hypothetical protein
MSIVYNAQAVEFESFKNYTKNFTDFKCITLDFDKINTKSTYGATVPIIFTDDRGKSTRGLTLLTNDDEKHCSNVYGERYSSYSINIQQIHSPLSLRDREGRVLREAVDSDYSQLFKCVAGLKNHLKNLMDTAIKQGIVRDSNAEDDDGKGKVYVNSLAFTESPIQYKTRTPAGKMVAIDNPIMRLRLHTTTPTLLNGNVFWDNSGDELTVPPGTPLTTDNASMLIKPRTLVQLLLKLSEVRSTKDGFAIGLYINGLGIVRPTEESMVPNMGKLKITPQEKESVMENSAASSINLDDA